ncbi:MAG: LTA synthase family protein [Paludibacteraceae bacterium]|nr:LTA synthase family protein [Paludibacteraceae bacterium]
MKSRLKSLLFVYLFWVVLFILQKPIFLLFHWNSACRHSFGEWLLTNVHGFSMDLSMAGYFTLPILVVLLVSCFFSKDRLFGNITKVLTIIFLSLGMLVLVSDLFLYKYWGFRLDATPLFYLSSPKDAAASGTAKEYLSSLLLFTLFLGGSMYAYLKLHKRFFSFSGKAYVALLPLLLLGGVMFIAIRGGVGVSTMNAGRCYFSKDIFLNHAAINPTWNFISACFSSKRFDDQYRFMPDEEAHERLLPLLPVEGDSTTIRLLRNTRPDVIFIIMEGIGSNVIETLGGEKGVAPNLNRLMEEGVLFTRFYANSFRTDRGLVSILSGYPAQPTSSVMKYPAKTQNMAKIPLSLKQAGYDLAFFYGGDDNFTNLHSYLVTSGFEKIITEKDFGHSEMSTKWGAYDHVVLNRLLKDIDEETRRPFFKAILTLNSHEPFDVPMRRLEEPYLNSVAYTDSCLGAFVDQLRQRELWNNLLLVILPDHAYRYPADLSSSCVARHEIPMLWLGGALNQQPMRVDTVCSQMDLARTLLSQMDLPADDFIFSKDIFGQRTHKFAYYAFPDGFGMIDHRGVAIFDNASGAPQECDNDTLLLAGKAFLQCLYDDLAKR